MSNVKTEPQTFNVPAISCAHCVTAITEHVAPLPGVAGVDVDLEAKKVTVVGGDRGAIIAAIDDAGYDVAEALPLEPKNS